MSDRRQPKRSDPKATVQLARDAGPIVGVILAGGRGRRVGGDKPLLQLHDKMLIEHVIARLEPQVDELWLSANGNEESLAQFSHRIIEDEFWTRESGPLAGIVSALEQAKGGPFKSMAVVPCDLPFLPTDLVERLAHVLATSDAPGVVVETSDGVQAICALWSATATDFLAAALRMRQIKLRTLCDTLGLAKLHVADVGISSAAFRNINTLADLKAASEVTIESRVQ